ncbi:MAG: 2-dehydropantoate 2-reductase [Erysipelotrichaceae bacterium]|nr:2-dehydropantoate 2-reductase [Erysipelotrichaceae bacterium]
MKIAILGSGSMGSLIGSYLADKHELIMIDAYEKLVETVKEKGIEVIKQDGTTVSYKPSIYLSGTCKEKVDLLISFVKDTTTDRALKDNIEMIGEDTIVLSLQNGMGNDLIFKKYIKEENILLGTTKHNAHTLGLGSIKHSGAGITHIGSLVGNFKLANDISDLLNEVNFETIACENVNHLLWEKLFVNITINALTSILTVSMDFLDYDSPIDPAVSNVLKEAIAVAKADGEDFDYDTIKKQLYDLTRTYIGGKASMEQDVEMKRLTEIDFINGSVVRIGKKYGIPTPVNETIVALVHSKEKLY